MSWFRKIIGGSGDKAAPTPTTQASAASPTTPRDEFEAADIWNDQADALLNQGRPAEALAAMSAAIESVHAALKDRTDAPARERWLAELYGKQGSIKVKLGDLDGASRSFLDSWVTCRAVADRFPADGELQAEVAIALNKIARVLMIQNRHRDALKFIQDASTIMSKVAKENLHEVKYRQYFNVFTEMLGECMTALGHPEIAATLQRMPE